MHQRSCPLGGFSVDNCVIRINAAIVSLLLAVYIVMPNVYIIAFLTLDFALRAFEFKFTLLNAPCRYIRKCYFNPEIVDGGSKLFAARIGFAFTLAILATYLGDMILQTQIIAFIMLFVSLLNAVFDYCMGCHVHTILYNLQLRFKN